MKNIDTKTQKENEEKFWQDYLKGLDEFTDFIKENNLRVKGEGHVEE